MCNHNLFTITAIDRHSSDSMNRTLSTENAELFRKGIEEFEQDLPYMRYELTTDEDIDDYSQEIIDILNEKEVSY